MSSSSNLSNKEFNKKKDRREMVERSVTFCIFLEWTTRNIPVTA